MTIKSLVTKAVTSSLIFASASSFAAVTQDQVVEHYADIAHAVFADSVVTAKALNSSIDTFLASPSAGN
ncbi:MAG: imelysin family protein, partial [Vibrio toranzoniae]